MKLRRKTKSKRSSDSINPNWWYATSRAPRKLI